LRRREAWTFVALVIVLIGFGIAPRPLVDSRFAAGDAILRLRQARLAGGTLLTPSPVSAARPGARARER
jgi:hypothetical protein